MAEKQRQREQELEEKEKLRRHQILAGEAARSSETPLARPQAEAIPAAAAATAAAASAAPAPTKYVPRHLREKPAGSAPAPATDRWRSSDRRGPAGGASRPTW